MSASKAWKVWDDYDEDGRMVVVHADTRGKAKRLGAGQLDCSEWTSLNATREPGFDGLHGDDLIRAQLRAGWWFGCAAYHCQKVVRDYSDDEENFVARYVVRRGNVYCSSECCIAELRRKVHERVKTWKALELATARWPGDPIHHVYENTSGDMIVSRFSVELNHGVTDMIPAQELVA